MDQTAHTEPNLTKKLREPNLQHKKHVEVNNTKLYNNFERLMHNGITQLRVKSHDKNYEFGVPLKETLKHNDQDTKVFKKLIPNPKSQIAVKSIYKSTCFHETKSKLPIHKPKKEVKTESYSFNNHKMKDIVNYSDGPKYKESVCVLNSYMFNLNISNNYYRLLLQRLIT